MSNYVGLLCQELEAQALILVLALETGDFLAQVKAKPHTFS